MNLKMSLSIRHVLYSVREAVGHSVFLIAEILEMVWKFFHLTNNFGYELFPSLCINIWKLFEVSKRWGRDWWLTNMLTLLSGTGLKFFQ